MDKTRLEALISYYREQTKPLMDDINVRLGGKFPDNCLNEIRAMLDHVSRCYRAETLGIKSEEKEKICDEELSKAEGHLRRLMFDCFKQLNIFLFDAIHQKEKQTYSSRWLYIDGGQFWSIYTTNLQIAMESVVEAKKNESYNPDKAIQCYEKAYNAYCAVEQMLIKHRKSLIWSRCIKYFEIVNRWLIWIGVTVLLSIISALIGYLL